MEKEKIKAEELRLNNLFIDAKGRICSVKEISKDIDNCRISSIEGALTTFPIEPIPLTEEWLIHFGFIQCENKHWYEIKFKKKGLTMAVNLNGRLNLENSKEDEIVIRDCCHFIHQLQNITYALTGIELTITPKE